MRFDWYQATIPAHPVDLVQSILSTLAPGGDVVGGPGQAQLPSELHHSGRSGR